MPEKPSHGLHYHVLPDDPVAALNILREAAGLEPLSDEDDPAWETENPSGQAAGE